MDWALGIIGVVGFWLAGKKIWWSWWVNVACQALWVFYAVTTKQYGFLVATAVYAWVFTGNAVSWTREHREKQLDH